MTEALSPTTKTDAVNILLAAIQESSVNSITGSVNEDVITAIKQIDQVTRQLQTDGWSFNTEQDFTLTPDLGSKQIVLPPNVMSVDLERTRWDVRPVIRGNRLYDRKNRTFTFDKPVKVKEMIILLPFDELPETARYYVAIKASRLFVASQDGDETLHSYTRSEEAEAYAKLTAREMEDEDHLIFDEVHLRRAARRQGQ